MKNLENISIKEIEKLSDEKILEIYNNLIQKDPYKMLEDVKNQMVNFKENTPENIKGFLTELIEIKNYGIENIATQGFIYQEDCKEFLKKVGDKIFPLIADHEEQFENKIAKFFQDEEILARVVIDIFVNNTCNIDLNLEKQHNQSIETNYKPKPKAIEKPIIEQGRGR